jgi:hypothetical protein
MEMYTIICTCGGKFTSVNNKYVCLECEHELTDKEIEKLLDQTYQEGMKDMNRKHVFLFDEECIVISPWDIEKTAVWYIKEAWSYIEGTEEYQEKYDELLDTDVLDVEGGMWWTDGELAQGNVDYKQNIECTTFGDKQSPEGYVEVFTKISEVLEKHYSAITEPVRL